MAARALRHEYGPAIEDDVGERAAPVAQSVAGPHEEAGATKPDRDQIAELGGRRGRCTEIVPLDSGIPTRQRELPKEPSALGVPA